MAEEDNAETSRGAVHQFRRIDSEPLLKLVRDAIREGYPELARAAAARRTSDPQKIAEAVAGATQSAKNLIEKTASLKVKGPCAA